MSHGATTTMEDFFELAKAFAADGWRVVLYDARDIEDRPTDLRGASVSLALGDELDADAVVALSPSADAFDALRAAGALPGETPVFVAAAQGATGSRRMPKRSPGRWARTHSSFPATRMPPGCSSTTRS
jgi:NAD(P)-dependent dehydrogenase (short-subunit alcohol dehydrogenase family)